MFINHKKLFGSLFCLFITMTGVAVAEQIVIDENSDGSRLAGDFHCSPCYNPFPSDSETVDIAASTLTAGELYQYFHSRGIRKLDRLSFQVDVDCAPDNSESVSLTDLSFQIQDAARNLVTHAGFGDSELLLDKSEITSFKPEAVIEFDLGYDFMQRFSADSQEAVVMNFNSTNTSSEMKPRIVVSSNISSFSSRNLTRIAAFLGFWGIIFFVAHVMSRKPADTDGNEIEKKVTLTANASARNVVAKPRRQTHV